MQEARLKGGEHEHLPYTGGLFGPWMLVWEEVLGQGLHLLEVLGQWRGSFTLCLTGAVLTQILYKPGLGQFLFPEFR